jgi:tRNA(fMet)-specific endonuclease VapC
MKLLIDTGIVIDIMQSNSYRPAFISPITLLEILRGIDDKKRHTAKQLLEESFTVLNLDNSIIEAYCKIYRKLKADGTLLPDADLLIAATAIAYDLTLQTKDMHFQRLKHLGLKIE